MRGQPMRECFEQLIATTRQCWLVPLPKTEPLRPVAAGLRDEPAAPLRPVLLSGKPVDTGLPE